MNSIRQHWDGRVDRVREYIVSLRYPRRNMWVWNLFLVIVALTRVFLGLLMCYSSECIATGGCSLMFRSLRAFFHFSFCQLKFFSALFNFLIRGIRNILALIRDESFLLNCLSALNFTLSPSYSGLSGSFSVSLSGSSIFSQGWNRRVLNVVPEVIRSVMESMVR